MGKILSRKTLSGVGVSMLSIIIPEILGRLDFNYPKLELGIYNRCNKINKNLFKELLNNIEKRE